MMPCEEHQWLFDSPCPKCHPPEITAAVTEPEVDDGPAVPDFLRRNRDGTLVDPAPWSEAPWSEAPRAAGTPAPVTLDAHHDPMAELARVAAMPRGEASAPYPEGWMDLPVYERQKWMRKAQNDAEFAKRKAELEARRDKK